MSTLERVIVVIVSIALLLVTLRATMTSALPDEVRQHALRRDARAERVERLNGQVAQLLVEVNDLADSPYAAERRVRDELNWTRPDEILLDFGAEPAAHGTP